MKLLLDTHALLWWVENNKALSRSARDLISDGGNEIFVSAVSGWEIAIKIQLGKLQVSALPEIFVIEQLAINSFKTLAVSMNHALHVSKLPPLHRDPFDRMLISQSQLENLPIVTADSLITQYDVQYHW